MVQNLEATVGMEVKADPFLKELENIFKQASDLIGSQVKGVHSGGGGESAPEKENKSLGGMGKMLSSIMGIASKIVPAALFIAAAIRIFQPAMNIINSGIKLISELLRPIADIVVLLLQPLLSLLKPIVMTMRTLMAPFKQAAQQLATAGTKAIMGGDTNAGIEMLMASIGVMIGPFITIITAEALKLAYDILLSGVEFVLLALITSFKPIINFFGGNVDKIKSDLSGAFEIIKSDINNTITGVEIKILTDMVDTTNEVMNDFGKKYPDYTAGLKNITADFSDVKKAAGNASTNLDDLTTAMNFKSPVDGAISDFQRLKKELSKPIKMPKISLPLGDIPSDKSTEEALRYADETNQLKLAR